ncbi:hypothetical protein B484DRAFT_331915 [Ochromonadaceae sp. CCMP2298]|nr:hypothetical protein B484DRAFT_331915 [Ochromonadaceae sp. CCMP2298]
MDQIQGIISVNVPVRSTIVKLKGGGLWVYNPVAPTIECIEVVRGLEALHGPVQHIILGTLGLEHKALAGPFSRYFPNATVWLQPGQWSFPINLPPQLFGFPPSPRTREIPTAGPNPWAADFDYEVLGPLKFKSVGGFGESAFLHRASGTLIVTDCVVQVGDRPSPILLDDPRALLFHSKDSMLEEVEDTEEARLRGWRRMALFGLVFYPSGILVSSVFETLKNLPKVSESLSRLGQGAVPISGGLYPWSWVGRFASLFGGSVSPAPGLLVAPILQTLILNREPERVLEWADRVGSWKFSRIIPSHLENNIRADGRAFRAAFSFLDAQPQTSQSKRPTTQKQPRQPLQPMQPTQTQPTRGDMALLRTLSRLFTALGIVADEVLL